MVTDIDLGKTGAKVSSWEKYNARALVLRLLQENPDDDDEALFHKFAAECAPYFMEICRHFFTNSLRALRKTPRGPSPDRVAAVAETVRNRLLDMMLPTGKMLRDSTFADAARCGGWLTALGKCGQPGQIIGAVMNEKEVRAVFSKE